jgi:hypothetical protein
MTSLSAKFHQHSPHILFPSHNQHRIIKLGAKSLSQSFMFRLRVICRLAYLTTVFTPLMLTFPLVWIGRNDQKWEKETVGSLWWYKILAWSLEQAGPAFIKV